jgi:hypothetical protein
MTYAFAIFSWHFIEKRALAYKSKVRKIDGLRKKNICRQKLSNLNHG